MNEREQLREQLKGELINHVDSWSPTTVQQVLDFLADGAFLDAIEFRRTAGACTYTARLPLVNVRDYDVKVAAASKFKGG